MQEVPDLVGLRVEGDKAFIERRYEEALNYYNRALKVTADNKDLLRQKAAALLALGKTEDALACYDQIISIEPRNPYALIEKGDLLTALDRFEEAAAVYDGALPLDPSSPRILLSKAAALRKSRHPIGALECLEEALSIGSQDARTWTLKGDVLIDLGKYEEAIGCFEEAERIDRAFQASDWTIRADTFYSLGRYAEAIVCYEKGTSADPNYFLAWRGKALACWALRDVDKAICYLDEALRIKPQDIASWMDKGNMLYDQEKYEDALICFDQTLRQDSTYPSGWLRKGFTLDSMGLRSEAIRCFDEVIKLDPSNVSALVGRGLSLSRLGRPEEAIVSYDKALALSPRYLWALNNKGWSLTQLREFEQAIKFFDQAIEVDPGEFLPWANKGRCLRDLGRIKEARECLEAGVQVVRDKRGALVALGGLFADYLGEYQVALDTYRRVLEFAPGDAVAKANMAECLILLKKFQEGRKEAQEAFEKSRDSRLKNISRILMLVAYAFERDSTNTSYEFENVAERIKAARSTVSRSKMQWTFESLGAFISKSDVRAETKFFLLTLLDIEQGLIPIDNLSFFKIPASKSLN